MKNHELLDKKTFSFSAPKAWFSRIWQKSFLIFWLAMLLTPCLIWHFYCNHLLKQAISFVFLRSVGTAYLNHAVLILLTVEGITVTYSRKLLYHVVSSREWSHWQSYHIILCLHICTVYAVCFWIQKIFDSL